MLRIYSFWGISGLYDHATSLTFLFRQREIRRRMVHQSFLERGDRVLDLCCGTGLNFTHLIEKVGPGGKIVGLDYTRAMLGQAKRRCERNGWRNVGLIQGDASRACLKGHSFDAVVCMLGISAVPHYEAALAHAVRMCRDGGRVVIADGHPFRGVYAPLNVVMVPVYRWLASWDEGKDIIGELKSLLGEISVEWYNGGTIYIAAGTKKGDPGKDLKETSRG
jgi:ubiquinone/menaquinone biosynthesis C-methylase UbiE